MNRRRIRHHTVFSLCVFPVTLFPVININKRKRTMPSQEFYDIIEMLIYPDVIEPETLRECGEQPKKATVGSSNAALPIIHISSN
jgi:hypothetical protein